MTCHTNYSKKYLLLIHYKPSMYSKPCYLRVGAFLYLLAAWCLMDTCCVFCAGSCGTRVFTGGGEGGGSGEHPGSNSS